MSADNGIYVLQTKDGFRVIHAQAIDNLCWWENYTCCNNPISVAIDGQEQCYHCGTYLPKHERRDELNPEMLKEYFGESKIFNTQQEAIDESRKMYDEIMNDDYGILEYGISYIRGWENEFFPE